MDTAVKAKWVAALRSGEYKQGAGALARGGRYCCLGVLCDLAVKAGVLVEVSFADEEEDQLTYDGADGVLPDSVVDWADLSHTDPEVGGVSFDARDLRLSAHNDSGKTFAEIADLIERYL